MAITTRIAPHFGWKYLIMAVVCLVLGAWGVYDYVEVIPSREQAHQRGDTARAVRDALVPGAAAELRDVAHDLLREEKQRFAERFPDVAARAAQPPTDDSQALVLARQAAESIDSLRADDQQHWSNSLATFDAALSTNSVREGEGLRGAQLHAYEVADLIAQRVATIKRPSAYDRPTQWAFILCLPFVPWCLWVYLATKKRVYRLDDDGTLHLSPAAAGSGPQTWKPEDIGDIDMSQWMRKSIAWVVHRDGTRIKMDDYKHKSLHLIIGAIASRLYPDDWDPDAKPVKAKRGEQPAAAGSGPGSAPDPAAGAEEPAEKA